MGGAVSEVQNQTKTVFTENGFYFCVQIKVKTKQKAFTQI